MPSCWLTSGGNRFEHNQVHHLGVVSHRRDRLPSDGADEEQAMIYWILGIAWAVGMVVILVKFWKQSSKNQ